MKRHRTSFPSSNDAVMMQRPDNEYISKACSDSLTEKENLSAMIPESLGVDKYILASKNGNILTESLDFR